MARSNAMDAPKDDSMWKVVNRQSTVTCLDGMRAWQRWQGLVRPSPPLPPPPPPPRLPPLPPPRAASPAAAPPAAGASVGSAPQPAPTPVAPAQAVLAPAPAGACTAYSVGEPSVHSLPC